MTREPASLLVIGATGSIGRPVVDAALTRGMKVRALVRNPDRARKVLPALVDLVEGDVTQATTLVPALAGVDAVVLVPGADGDGKAMSEAVYYNGMRDVLAAIGPRRVRIALMTTIGVTVREGSYNRRTEVHDWKRRAERLLRMSGQDYTIVRPGWFDGNGPGQQKILMLQGDNRRSGTSADGAIGRGQIARVLVESLFLPVANRKTFELITEPGAEQTHLLPLFAALEPDLPGHADSPRDIANQPLAEEPLRVRNDLAALLERLT